MGQEQPSEFYDDMYGSSVGWRYKLDPNQTPWWPAWDWVMTRLEESDRVLDLGCGVGQFAKMAYQRGLNRYHGIDFSKVAIDRANRTFKNLLAPMENAPSDDDIVFTFEVGDITDSDLFERLEFDFNVIVMTETLEHINADLDLIRRIPEGTKVLFSVPSYDDPSHARFFDSMSAVMNRFAPHFRNLYIDSVVRAHKPALIWVGEGTV